MLAKGKQFLFLIRLPLQYSLMFIYTGESSRFVVFSREGSVYCQICRIQLQSKFFNVSCRNNDIKSMSMLFLAIYTSQQKKRYKGLMLNIFYIEKKKSTKIVEIVMQYGGLWSSVTCVATSWSNDSFASPTHRTNQSLDKGLWDVFPLVHKCVTHLLWCFRWI